MAAGCSLVTLTFDLWPWNWFSLLPAGWTTYFLPILVFLGRFVLDISVNTCQTHHDCDLVTLEVTARGGDAGLRVPSVYCIPSFKFVGLSFRKISHTSALSISRPGDLGLWPLTLKLVVIMASGIGNLPTNVGLCFPSILSLKFVGRPFGRYCAFIVWALVGLVTLTFDLLTFK